MKAEVSTASYFCRGYENGALVWFSNSSASMLNSYNINNEHTLLPESNENKGLTVLAYTNDTERAVIPHTNDNEISECKCFS